MLIMSPRFQTNVSRDFCFYRFSFERGFQVLPFSAFKHLFYSCVFESINLKCINYYIIALKNPLENKSVKLDGSVLIFTYFIDVWNCSETIIASRYTRTVMVLKTSS